MGQKVNPHGLRVGVIKDWNSKWYAEADFADYLVEDHKIRTYLKKKLYSAGVAKIEIERASDSNVMHEQRTEGMLDALQGVSKDFRRRFPSIRNQPTAIRDLRWER